MKQSTVRKIILSIFSLIAYHFSLVAPAYANCVDPEKGVQIGDCFGFGQFSSLGDIISKLVAPIFSIAASLVIIYFLWGAFKILQSGGNKEEIAGGRQMITHAIIGFMILIFVFFVLPFLLSSLFDIKGFRLF